MKACKANLASIILPCYNEKKNVIRLASRINEILKAYDFEILIVDDNSPDNTYSALRKLGIPNVIPILRTEGKGLANSIRTGLEKAKGESIVIMDSDFNHNPEYIPFLFENLKFYDCVSASRFLYGGIMDSRMRHLLSWVLNVFELRLADKLPTTSTVILQFAKMLSENVPTTKYFGDSGTILSDSSFTCSNFDARFFNFRRSMEPDYMGKGILHF